MKIAQSLHINEVKMPAGVRVKSHVNYTIAVVSVPEKEEVVAPPVAATPAAGAPAAGDAKAAEGKGGAPAPAAAEGKGAPAKKDEKKK